MADWLQNKAKALLLTYLSQQPGLTAILLTSAYSPDKDHQFASSLSAAEASTDNYTPGYGSANHVPLTGLLPTEDDAGDLGKLVFDPLVFVGVGPGGGYAVRWVAIIQEIGGSYATSPVIAVSAINGGADVTLDGGDLTLTLGAAGVTVT